LKIFNFFYAVKELLSHICAAFYLHFWSRNEKPIYICKSRINRKNMIKKLLLLITVFVFTISAYAQHDFTFKIKGIADTTIYLANYFGGKMYFNDTTVADANGIVRFRGDESKPGGIYAVIFPDNKTYFQVVVNESKIVMETTVNDPEGNMVVKVSEENKAFYEYLKFVTGVQGRMGELSNEKKKDGADQEKIDVQIKVEQEKAEKFKAAYLKKNQNLFAAKVLNTSDEINVPEFMKEDGTKDDKKRFVYYHDHYFDNVDLKDDRLLRTPVLNQKIETYLKKLTPQVPDSICVAVQDLTNRTASDTSLMYKYIVQYATNTFEKSDIMGMDAVFVCIAENYYAKDKAWWVEDDKLDEILKMYNTRKNLVIGKKADNIVLMDVDSNWKALYDIKAKYTVVVFWDPNCGHCKKEMPKLQEFYAENKSKGVEVFSVSTEFDNKDWPAYIKEQGYTWIDVSDNPEINKNAHKHILEGKTTLNSLNFRDYWDIFSTPQFYLLDENKVIIAKKINAEQMPDFIQQYETRKAAEAEEAVKEIEKSEK
jgi:thiol-disulfide isomerase/thioredoxin